MAKKNFKRQSTFQSKNEIEDEHYISKSQAKRDVEELQKLGEKLVKLSRAILESFKLEEKLMDALLLAQNIHSNSAKRRQRQLIGKLMRQADYDKIRTQLERYQNQAVEANAYFHKLENYRDQLLAQGDKAVNHLLNDYPQLDRSRLRQLLRNAKKETEQNKPPKSTRQIFQYLKNNIQE
ncbi:MAG: DUF615 domain-containing protein [gamma proteobacterium symbiont of Taylorina sp.]|nr:DUF615 domain-containing protein [gamma proteobacterium symbiont of Taylorina sp.]